MYILLVVVGTLSCIVAGILWERHVKTSYVYIIAAMITLIFLLVPAMEHALNIQSGCEGSINCPGDTWLPLLFVSFFYLVVGIASYSVGYLMEKKLRPSVGSKHR